MSNSEPELVYHDYESYDEPDYYYWTQYRDEDDDTRTSQRFDTREEAKTALREGRVRWSRWS